MAVARQFNTLELDSTRSIQRSSESRFVARQSSMVAGDEFLDQVVVTEEEAEFESCLPEFRASPTIQQLQSG